MIRNLLCLLLFTVTLGAGAPVPTSADPAGIRPHAGMLRYPDVSATQIAFLYGNDLWLVPREGGTAVPLASPPGQEMFPRFSPDGKTLAFMGNYDGNRDLYTIPVTGGVPFRVTYHPSAEYLCDWTPAGRLIFYGRGMATYPRANELFTVGARGGLPEKLPVPYGANGAVSPDGAWLAYTLHTRDRATWKRYRGGTATDIWLFHLEEHASEKITDWEGTDSLPMWHGGNVYYLSDAGPRHRLNIWVREAETGANRQVTTFRDFDVKWPAVGPGPDGGGEIVFQVGTDLVLLDLQTEKTRTVEVTIPGDRPRLRPTLAQVRDLIYNQEISSSGRRAVIEARGDIWTLPAEHGTPRNLTRTSGAAERNPAWSPDGQWIAYFSDATGEYELYLIQSDGKGEARQLTRGSQAFYYDPQWSPDSRQIAFWDKGGTLFLHTVESGKTRTVDQDLWAERHRVSFSPDSRWLAYPRTEENIVTALWIYDTREDTRHQVTSGLFNDRWPTFDREGKYLFFTSDREFTDPQYEDVGSTFVYAHTGRLYVVPLQKDVPSPFAPESDEELWGEKAKEEKARRKKKGKPDRERPGEENGNGDGEESGEDKDEAPVEPVVIDLEGFERRAVLIPVERGRFANLAVNDRGQLLYVRGAAQGRGRQDQPAIRLFDLEDEEREEKTVLADVGFFAPSADGKKLLVRKNRTMAIVDARPKQKLDQAIDLSGLRAEIDPRQEWRQILTDAWRIQRDFFYDPHMHGVNWKAVRRHYEQMLADCTSREDVSYVIREMISELNVGHAYYWGGSVESAPSLNVGMFGCDYALEDGAYRITRIYEGGPWDVDARGPLSQPGVDVRAGDYLLAVNGRPVDPAQAPWAAGQGLAGKVVTLTVSAKPKRDEEAREVVVTLLANEGTLRYRAWVERNRAYVAERTEGRVGYIYVPDTGVNGQNNLLRQFYGQIDKEALIIDERWNGGGQIPTRFIELLNRPVANYWARRDGRDWPWPYDAHFGPKCMLINGLAGSGGDYFPYYFRQVGLGKLIGTRTWGGLVGISGNPALVDGGYTSVPTFAFYETDGTWGIEGHGVDPDIEVIDDPALMVGGKDPQLDAAVDHMLAEIQARPYRKPKRPAYANRSGMGLPDADK